MANETEYSNFTKVAAYVAANSAPAFVASSIMRNLIAVEAPAPGSNAKLFNKKGTLSMSVVAESASATKSEYTETATTVTLQKGVVYFDLTHEAERFTGGNRLQELAEEAGRAAARKYDTDVMAMFDGFSQVVGSTGVDVTVAVFRQAAYTLDLGNAAGDGAFVAHPTAIFDLGTSLIGATGTVWGNAGMDPSILSAKKAQAGFKGFFLNLPVYSSTLTESINTGADWSCACLTPYAIASLLVTPFEVDAMKDIPTSLKQASLIMDYGLAEWNDTAGVGILADQ